jgi:hypothetical protein
MATYSFTRLSSGTVKVVADGNTYFIPGGCLINPNDTLDRIIVTSTFGHKITMDSALDTINIGGVANTGTATEIAEDLATDIFFLASGGGVEGITPSEGAILMGDWSAAAPFLVDIATSSTSVGLYADTNGSFLGAFGTASVEVIGFQNTGGAPTDDQKGVIRFANSLAAEYRTSNTAPHVFKVNSVEVARINSDGFVATKFYLSALNTAPASAGATGTAGEVRIDASHIYVCTATNTWKRVAIATW